MSEGAPEAAPPVSPPPPKPGSPGLRLALMNGFIVFLLVGPYLWRSPLWLIAFFAPLFAIDAAAIFGDYIPAQGLLVLGAFMTWIVFGFGISIWAGGSSSAMGYVFVPLGVIVLNWVAYAYKPEERSPITRTAEERRARRGGLASTLVALGGSLAVMGVGLLAVMIWASTTQGQEYVIWTLEVVGLSMVGCGVALGWRPGRQTTEAQSP